MSRLEASTPGPRVRHWASARTQWSMPAMKKLSMLMLAVVAAFAALALVAVQFALSLPPLFEMLGATDSSMIRQLVRDLTTGLFAT